jgi:uncharacterized protein
MKHAIVTGASKGLGKALAHQLAGMGYHLLLVARSEKELTSVAQEIHQQFNIPAVALSLDLSEVDAPHKVVQWCANNKFHPSVLINNAGYACWGYFDSIALHQHHRMMQVNMNTLVDLTHSLLPQLRLQQKAFILNVASTTAFQAVPTLALYAASKAFVRSFSRGLRYELKNSSVSVTCLSPGPMATNFIQQAGMEAMQETATKFEMTAEEVARQGLKALFKGKSECTPGLLNYITVKLSFIIPDVILEKIAANLYISKL